MKRNFQNIYEQWTACIKDYWREEDIYWIWELTINIFMIFVDTECLKKLISSSDMGLEIEVGLNN